MQAMGIFEAAVGESDKRSTAPRPSASAAENTSGARLSVATRHKATFVFSLETPRADTVYS